VTGSGSLILWPMRSNPAAKIYVKAEDALSDFLSFVIVHYSQRRFNVSFASLIRHLRQVSNDRVEFVARFDRQRFQPWPRLRRNIAGLSNLSWMAPVPVASESTDRQSTCRTFLFPSFSTGIPHLTFLYILTSFRQVAQASILSASIISQD
jgi:hypothetical protein